MAGFFTGAQAILVGRTEAPGRPTMTQHEAVADALGGLGVPILADVECGHVPPYLPLVNGALARVRLDGDTAAITQTLA
jgi:muramoyltetrapeptide carboxypeptidase LdcA involved in peptidoglycan recycling